MSYSGLGDDWISSVSTSKPAPPPFAYLSNGAGMEELQRVATETVTALLGSGGTVGLIRSGASPATGLWVPPNQTIGAIWGGSRASALLLASTVVATMVAAERAKPAASRWSVSALASAVVQRVTDKLLNAGDPSICQINFEASMNAWKAVYPVIPVPKGYTPTGFCARELIFSPGTEPCQLTSICKWTIDAAGKAVAVSAPPPPPGKALAPPSASSSAPQPPPTHAQLDAAAKSSDDAQALTEFATYMTAMKQGRDWLALALGLPVTTTDDTLWNTLHARGISTEEAVDWFNGCNAELNCFRQRMNRSLGEAEQRATDNRAKVAVGVAVIGAVAFAWYTYRGGWK